MLSGLMIDDEPLVGRSLVRYLKPRGIALDFVCDAGRFWQKVREGTHRVIALDEQLGWGRGSEICSKLRAAGERRAIALVSHCVDDEEGAGLADACGADAFAPKTPEGVWHVLERLAHVDPRRTPPSVQREVSLLRYRHAFTGERVDVRGGEIVMRAVPELSPLERGVFTYLLQRAPDVVSASELRRDVWKVNALARSAVSNVVGRLIAPLPGWIERVRRGYRARAIP